ncbi:MAG: hypothetical protein ACT4PU_05355 [Planctomycetota bacterium]
MLPALVHALRRVLLHALLLLAAGPAALLAAPQLTLVHADANVGGASAGHAALRLGDVVYHYQRGDDGLLRLAREPWTAFVLRYNDLGNRSLRLVEIEAAPGAAQALDDHFTVEYGAQQSALAHCEALRLDVAWLAALSQSDGQVLAAHDQRATEQGRAWPSLVGAGLLQPPAVELAEGQEAPLLWAKSLRAELEQLAGAGALRKRRFAAEARVLDWFAAAPAGDLSALREALCDRQALLALEHAWVVPEEALLVAPGPTTLTADERCALETQAADALAGLLELLDSPRPDRGLALLVTTARWQAARRSLSEGRLLVVDPWPSGAARLAAEELAGAEARHELARRAAAVVEGVRTQRGAVMRGEWEVGLLEEAVALAVELRAAAEGQPVRRPAGRLWPQRSARPAPWGFPAAGGDWSTRRAEVQAELAAAEQQLREACRYDLLARNCITRLAEALTAAFPDPELALGGPIPSGTGPSAVPWVFCELVERDWRVLRSETWPGRRRRELTQLLDRAPSALTEVCESLTLTSSLYEPLDRDGRFLCFTDGALWWRPLGGALNLAYGLGSAAGGLLSWPWDGGAALSAGASGALFSLPELAGICLRKGSYEVPLDAP